nr:RNA methyltransferase [Oxalobacteraceae bacterium]
MANTFERVRFVLVETSHPGNVGAAARAMKTMGFSDLVLVNPRDADVLTHAEAIALASGATDVLAAARIVHSLDEALAGCNFSVALSARPREFSPPLFEPRQLAGHLVIDTALKAALVFGSERYGLSNEQVSKCSALVSVPANPVYSSLNLAQAVQVIAYECRVAALGEVRSEDAIGFRGERASAEQVEGMFTHLEKALIDIDFLDAKNPKKLMPRLRRLFARAELEVEEVNILRGIATQLISKRQRIRKD